MRFPWSRRRRGFRRQRRHGDEATATSAQEAGEAVVRTAVGPELAATGGAPTASELTIPETVLEQRQLKRLIEGPLTEIRIPSAVLEATGDFLRLCGREHYEAVVLWVGVVDVRDRAEVLSELVPRQIGYRTRQGVAVQIPDEEINRILSTLPLGTLILCRVHSHPGQAYHSQTDDMNLLLAHAGAISIVAPDFAREPIALAQCSVNELDADHQWRELAPAEVARRFVVVD